MFSAPAERESSWGERKEKTRLPDLCVLRKKIRTIVFSYLFLRQSVTPSHLADLMALIISTGRTIPAIIFSLTTSALSASLSLLLRGFFMRVS